MAIKVGLCGFTIGASAYFKTFPVVEVQQTFYDPPAGGEMVDESAILPYPLQNALTRPMRTAAVKRGEAGFLSLWAGTGVAKIRSLPAGELAQRLVEELRATEAER
ncbi:MAG TPA: hypothetical protein VJ853_06050 [Thermoanaerobaculia bacterium]|nr:hypothetical protein [Thermoanaerobaculia bacterium]